MFQLLFSTPRQWTEKVLSDFDRFLIDHAMAEKKASGMAMSMLSHYPDKTDLVSAMIDLSIEELTHFKAVLEIMAKRNLIMTPDEKDPYVNEFRKAFRKGSDVYLMDRLLVGGIIEARGCERFGLVGDSIADPELGKFYSAIAKSEAKHQDLFVNLAHQYCPVEDTNKRLQELLEIEANIVADLPIRAALH